ncbi:MAG: DUF2889 domain-containing protein [Peptococcaceae bacterium]|nr:DUF2889 domain-containing protein [Peptococcaceae bacterium]
MNLFNRSITVNVNTADKKILEIAGTFIDSYHELYITLVVDIEQNQIDEARGEMKRTPNEHCFYVEGLIPQLKGISLETGIRKRVLQTVGGSGGCTHLTELVLECIKGAIQGRFKLMELSRPELSLEDLVRTGASMYKNSCYTYSKYSV